MAAERKGKKLRRCAKQAGYYKAQYFVSERNKKSRLGTHVRHFPEDSQAIARLTELCGDSVVAGHLANLCASARRRAA